MDSFLDRAIVAFVTRAPGWAVFVLAAFLYGCLGLALPLALHWRVEFHSAANVVFTIMAAVICVYNPSYRWKRQLVGTWSNGQQICASSLPLSSSGWSANCFGERGWSVTETGREDGPDGNTLTSSCPGERAERRAVQAVDGPGRREWTRSVALAALCYGRRLPATAGIFVTLSNFTEQAGTEAHQMGITLIDKRDLYSRMEKARRAEPCPDCRAPMVLSHSDYGWWLRCDQRGCRGEHDPGRDTGRRHPIPSCNTNSRCLAMSRRRPLGSLISSRSTASAANCRLVTMSANFRGAGLVHAQSRVSRSSLFTGKTPQPTLVKTGEGDLRVVVEDVAHPERSRVTLWLDMCP